jgi:hypothetical protein
MVPDILISAIQRFSVLEVESFSLFTLGEYFRPFGVVNNP